MRTRSIAAITILLALTPGAMAAISPSFPDTFYGRNFTRSLEHFDPAGSGFEIPVFPKGPLSIGGVNYPNFSDPQRHRLPVFVQTSIENLYGAPIPSGKTAIYFLVMTLSQHSSKSSVAFGPHDSEPSTIGAQDFQPGTNYLLYEYSQGKQVGPSVPVTFNSGTWIFTAPFAGQTFLRNVPIIYEFVK